MVYITRSWFPASDLPGQLCARVLPLRVERRQAPRFPAA